MSSSLDDLLPELAPYAKELVRAAGAAGLHPRVTSTRRSSWYQTALYLKFLSGRAKYPTAFPGTSAHEYGEAFDMVVTPYEALADVGDYWQQLGGSWAGKNDPIHFELPGASASHRIGPRTHTIAQAADFALGLIPGVSEIQLGATLLHWGYPQSEIFDFLSGPLGYITK